MSPRISIEGLSVRVSVRQQFSETADNDDFSLENHCGHMLIHFGRILLSWQYLNQHFDIMAIYW